jgi:N-acetylglutamate synthase-like GNAT family acetyltransferase
MLIRRVNIKEINHLIVPAKKTGLSFCKSVILYGLFNNGNLVGFTGVIIKKNKVIFKNHYVIEEHRRKGYFNELFNYSILLTKELKIKTVEATCTEMSLQKYLASGFKIVKKYKKYTKVIHENL